MKNNFLKNLMHSTPLELGSTGERDTFVLSVSKISEESWGRNWAPFSSPSCSFMIYKVGMSLSRSASHVIGLSSTWQSPVGRCVRASNGKSCAQAGQL